MITEKQKNNGELRSESKTSTVKYIYSLIVGVMNTFLRTFCFNVVCERESVL